MATSLTGPAATLPSAATGAEKPGFRRDLEGLRGVAIVLVVLYHVRLDTFLGGYIGVDVFFVLSGFLITGLLARQVQGRGHVDFWDFYARRFRRLLPALLVMVVLTLLAGLVVGSPIDIDGWVHTARSVPVFLSNFVFAHRAADYLGGDSSSDLYLHTWTLAVEEQFYLVWPALLAAAVWVGNRLRSSRPSPPIPSDRSKTSMIAAIASVVVVSGIASLYLTERDPVVAFFGPFTRFWEFGVGALIALLPTRFTPFRLMGIGSAALGLVAILYASLRFDNLTAFPGTAAMIPVAGTALILFSGLGPTPRFRNLALDNPPMRWLGKRSYSWYLWHWPAIVLAEDLYSGSGSKAKALVALLSLGVADLSYRFVETPTRHRPSLVAEPRRTVLLGIGIIVSASVILTALGVVTGHWVTSGPAGRYRDAAADIPAAFTNGCVASFDATTPSTDPTCVYGDEDADRVIVVMGDSHAAQWLPALDAIGKAKGLRVVPFTKSGCPVAEVEITPPVFRRPYRECDQFRERSIEAINELRPEHIMLTSFTEYVTDGIQGLSADDWEGGMGRTIRALQPSGAQITVVNDVPRSANRIPTCLERQTALISLDIGDCSFPRSTPAAGAVARAERRAARAEGVRVADPTTAVCPEPTCRPERDGVITYFDNSHLSATYVRTLAPWLQQALGIGSS